MGLFTCEKCGHEKTTPAAYEGRTAKCPKCKHPSVVKGTPSPVEVEPESEPRWKRLLHRFQDGADVVACWMRDWAKHQGPSYPLPIWAAILLIGAWGTLGAVTIGCMSLMIYSLLQVESEGALAIIGGLLSVIFIPGYVIVRCVDKVIRAIARR